VAVGTVKKSIETSCSLRTACCPNIMFGVKRMGRRWGQQDCHAAIRCPTIHTFSIVGCCSASDVLALVWAHYKARFGKIEKVQKWDAIDKGVDQTLAVLMVILGGLVVTPIFFNTVNDAAALLFDRGADFLSAFDKARREAFVMLLLNLHHQLDLAIDFWGLWLIPFGLLVYRSRFLPRVLGVRLMIACFEYPALSFTGLLFHIYEEKVFKFAQRVLFAEGAIMLWLVIMGAGEKRLAAASS
jgi:uncharacterized protein DUF4386